ncbi:hypothetical protein ACQK5W_05415 [Pantoea sp. FN060301]|uniref:hypothetical protein n=1 Tax=Pantoea sp. FN060301 TaxID=3420380 RepID=UPI003D164873
MKRLRKALCWLLCAVMLTGAVACAGEKGASGQNSPSVKTQHEKLVVSGGKDREKVSAASGSAPDNVVVENNAVAVPVPAPVPVPVPGVPVSPGDKVTQDANDKNGVCAG